jgi:hypothetical protein
LILFLFESRDSGGGGIVTGGRSKWILIEILYPIMSFGKDNVILFDFVFVQEAASAAELLAAAEAT